MITIQEFGLSVMSENPLPIYIVGGDEYGIKDKYMEILRKHFGNQEEHSSVSSLTDMLSVKHIVPLKPSLYVVRYDETFVSAINAQLAQKIKSLKFNGSIFCVYSDSKHVAKLDKFLPDYTCSVEPVDMKYISKYLHSDFPKLDDRCIKIASSYANSYGHARTLCVSMSNADPSTLARMPEYAVAKMLGCETACMESDIQKAVAGRNFAAAATLIENYEGDLDSLMYTILQTMIELEKILSSKYSDSTLKDFAKLWKVQDVYYMFMNTYNELAKLRSNTSTDIKSSLIYLFGLMTFRDIPSVEVMHSGI